MNMCGRFNIAIAVGWPERFGVQEPSPPIELHYNIAPTQLVPVIVRDSPNRIQMMQWGLVPFWARDPKIGSRMINARAETIAEKPAFSHSYQRHRCLVPATGFYEWKKTPQGRIPYNVCLKDHSLFAMAGLFDRWTSPEGQELFTFTIVTTEPNSLSRPLHDRMPAILRREHEPLWLQTEPLSMDELFEVTAPYPSEEMEAYPVTSAVNTPANDTADLIKPVNR
jgi:putative SOS response-associated peptidase YedK